MFSVQVDPYRYVRVTVGRPFFAIIGLTMGIVFVMAAHVRAQNVIADWHLATETIVADSGRKNAVALPYFAYVDVAMYDAVNSIDGRFQPFAVRVCARRGASREAAAAAAAHDVLAKYFSSPSQLVALNAYLTASLAAIPDDHARSDGVIVGEAVAQQWLAQREGDGLEANVVFIPRRGPGSWEPMPMIPPPPDTPSAPEGVWMRQFKPFGILKADQFLNDVRPPLPLISAAWARDFNRTKAYGARASSVRTPAQTEIGRFWTDNVAVQYSSALRSLIINQGLDTVAAARLGAMTSVVMSDAVTACMNAKYQFAFWRPYTAIHDADTDGNPATEQDRDWVPLAATPGHPEYPANHGCVTRGLMNTLTAFFGTDDVPYTVASAVTNTSQTFDRFDDVVSEVNNARIYGGMHFHRSIQEGNRLGGRVAAYVLKRYFLHREIGLRGRQAWKSGAEICRATVC